MSVYGIVSEFNPFHNGHAHLFDEARRAGAEYIVCVMSGNAVQRGTLAVADKYSRAEAAVRCGADVVLELPFPWSASSAESFARAGVNILSQFADTLIFGSECADPNLLERCAAIAMAGAEAGEYRKKLESGERSAEAYISMLEKGVGEYSVRFGSNDILGVEYIKAIKRQGLDINIRTIAREGTDYRDTAVLEGKYQSAAAIRKMLYEGDYRTATKYMPTAAAKLIVRAKREGSLCLEGLPGRETLAFFRLHNAAYFSEIACCEGGIANRICAAALESSDFDEMFGRIRTKRYTDAKLRRALLFGMTGVTSRDTENVPAYTLLLAASASGCRLLAEKRKTNDGICVVTKPADVDKIRGSGYTDRQNLLGERLEAIFTIATEKPTSAGTGKRKSPCICV